MKFLILLALSWHLYSKVISDDVKDPSNFCMKALYHKETPGPEALLHGQVWDGSWEYTPDDKPCMKIWFDPANGNPNDAVFSSKMQSTKPASTNLLGLCSLIFILMFVIILSLFVAFVKMRNRFRKGILC
ncbi:hypothetical protein V9T40_012365 [Parthenolecanium corni]|uniref:Uncharacterized protein n=1 Tax=Parthenolecanium corni TaxID=536013 RepID=A0AAN9XZD9_9HEMI